MLDFFSNIGENARGYVTIKTEINSLSSTDDKSRYNIPNITINTKKSGDAQPAHYINKKLEHPYITKLTNIPG